ncbi:MAG: sodium/substrate symporter small subunit, partial [Gammaproteobacteria bacterium]
MSADTSRRGEHWQRTKRLMIITLILWFIFSFVVHWFADSLNA